MTTATATAPWTSAELLYELEALLRVATQYAALEDRLERRARAVFESEWQFSDQPLALMAAVEAQIGRAIGASLCASIQDAIDVLTFALERSDDAS